MVCVTTFRVYEDEDPMNHRVSGTLLVLGLRTRRSAIHGFYGLWGLERKLQHLNLVFP